MKLRKLPAMLSFDESFNEKAHKCQMDLLVGFWDILSNQVKSCYWDSNFIGHSTATDILNSFLGSTKNMDEWKMIQIWMD